MGRTGADIGRPRRLTLRCSAAAASSGVWNGLGTASRFDFSRRDSMTTSRASTTRAVPPTTNCCGAFSAQTQTWPANGSSAAATAARSAITESMAP